MKKVIIILIISFLMPFMSMGQRQQNLPYYYNPGLDSLPNKKFEYIPPRIHTDSVAKFKLDTSIFDGIGSLGAADSTNISQGNGILFFTPTPDTTACIMLVCDTTNISAGNSTTFFVYVNPYTKTEIGKMKDYVPYVFWMKGYSITPRPNWMGIKSEYLDENKRPLSNNIIVWMSQEVKK